MSDYSKAKIENAITIVPKTAALGEDAELWRYMRLSTLLMLLRDKVYVPTIAELRAGDPVEAKNLCKRTRSYFDSLPQDDQDWLLTRATSGEKAILGHQETGAEQKARTFLAIWNRELAQRRRIWCWHNADIESMALWHIYAREGIAVKTTPARIKKSFDPYFVDKALIAPVSYIDHAREESLTHHFLRPYLFKQRCYQHEREVRIIFPRDSDDPDGRRLLPVDHRQLISGIGISPHIPRSEAVEIRFSILKAWEEGNREAEISNAPSIFVSDAKTVFDSPIERISFNQPEGTGMTNFGSFNMPFLIIGDFDTSAD
jgi:hypothetical protein